MGRAFLLRILFIAAIYASLLAPSSGVSALTNTSAPPGGPDASLLAPASSVSATPWEQTITPLGGGFESTYPGNWVLIRTQNTVSCSTDAANAIYTRTRTPPYTNDVDWARWRPNIPATGQYQVFVYVPSYTHNVGVTTRGRYQVSSASGTTTVIFDQNIGRCSWRSLGWYQFNAGTSGFVYLGDYTGDNPFQLLSADGLKFVANQPPLIPAMVAPTNGATVASANVTVQAQDAGDPDNGPRNSRDFQFMIEQIGTTWSQTSTWTGSSWSVTLPSDGDYRWRVQAGDGANPSGWSSWSSFTRNTASVMPALTRSRLYVDSRNYLMLEFCGRNINQNVYVGSRRDGRDFGIITKAVTFGATEQCAVADNLAAGGVLPSTVYRTGVALRSQDVYTVCGSAQGLCDSIKTGIGTPVGPPQPPPAPAGSWKVPFFSQLDPRWKNNRFGTCSGTIGKSGCALTSVAMNLAYYGVDTDPNRLQKSMGAAACPLVWSKAVYYSQQKVAVPPDYWPKQFSWTRLETELKKGPVIVELTHTYCNGCHHFVVALSGSGGDPRNYLVNDPGVLDGRRVRLSQVLVAWKYQVTGMRLYIAGPKGQPAGPASSISAMSTEDGLPVHSSPTLAATEIVTGSTTLYRYTETSMTMEMSAVSSAGPVTEMRIWTDTTPSDTWQPFAPYVELPLSNWVYVQFRDQAGNVSGVVSASTGPELGPPELPPSWEILLPSIVR